MRYLDQLTQMDKGESIYIYGAGSFSKTFYDQLSHHRNDIIVDDGWSL